MRAPTMALRNILITVIYICNMVVIYLMLGKYTFFNGDIGSVCALIIDLVCAPFITALICVMLFHKTRVTFSIAVTGIWLIIILLVLL